MSAPHPYLLVHPRLERRSGSPNQRRRSERFVAHIALEMKSRPGEQHPAADVSRDGLLVAISPLPPIKQPLMLSLLLPDGPLAAMAVVVRHTVIDSRPAMGLMLLSLPLERELRWVRAIARVAEARRSESLVERSLSAPPMRGPGEYSFVTAPEPRFDIDVVLDGA